MQAALKFTTRILPGGKIQIADPDLKEGEEAELIVFLSQQAGGRRSVVEVLASAPGHPLFQNATDVDSYLREERDSWDR